MTAAGTLDQAPRWRSARWRLSLSPLLFWGLTFYVALALLAVAPRLGFGGILLAIPVSIVACILLNLSAQLAAAQLHRFVDPKPVPPPPDLPEGNQRQYVRPPRVVYPLVELAKGQSGWVALRLKSDRRGRVVEFQILAQAPGRSFENAVAIGLSRTRLLLPADNAAIQETETVVTFVTRGRKMPDWVVDRLAKTKKEL